MTLSDFDRTVLIDPPRAFHETAGPPNSPLSGPAKLPGASGLARQAQEVGAGTFIHRTAIEENPALLAASDSEVM